MKTLTFLLAFVSIWETGELQRLANITGSLRHNKGGDKTARYVREHQSYLRSFQDQNTSSTGLPPGFSPSIFYSPSPQLPTMTVALDSTRPEGSPTVSSKLSNSLQTVHNVTFLLNNLLHQYDNSLRPDLGGTTVTTFLFCFRHHKIHSFFSSPGDPLTVDINMQVRSMGPISEIDMVRTSLINNLSFWVFTDPQNIACV